MLLLLPRREAFKGISFHVSNEDMSLILDHYERARGFRFYLISPPSHSGFLRRITCSKILFSECSDFFLKISFVAFLLFSKGDLAL